jgi:hypothetical protein
MQYVAAGVGVAIFGAVLLLFRARIAWALFETRDPTTFGRCAGAIVAIGLLLAVVSLFRGGKAFEVRAYGVRYTGGGRKIDIPWREVQSLQVWKTKVLHKGQHVRTEWRMHIVGSQDEIRLSESFFTLVSDVPALVTMIEVKSGVKFQHVTEEDEEQAAEKRRSAKKSAEDNLSAEELILRGGGGRKRRRKRSD